MDNIPLLQTVIRWLFFVASVSPAVGDLPARSTFPGTEWSEATPASQGVNATQLEIAVAFMDRNFGPDGANELVIIRHGRLIWKGPHIDAYHNIWSGTKVFTSTVLGLLIQDRKCTLDDLAVKYEPELDDQYPRYARIKLRHLASMSSGYQGHLVNTTPEQPWGDPMSYLNPSEPLFDSGTQVQYHDHQVFLLGRILTELAGESERDLFKRRIADPIGMTRWDWGISGKVSGIALNNAAGTPSAAPGIQTTARELARFGLLYLNYGRWQEKQLLPESFVEAATENQVPDVGASGFLRGRFGFYWWTNDPRPDGERPWPSAPPKTYTLDGKSCNFCFIIPEWDMVIVRMGTAPIRKGVAGLAEVDRLWDAFFGRLVQAMQR